MSHLQMVGLTRLMERTSGSPDVKIGFVDGPVGRHPDLAGERHRHLPGKNEPACGPANRTACLHGTFVAGILCARRGSPAPAICPDCTLLIRPIFPAPSSGPEHLPSATPAELADAILECVDQGARLINLSLALAAPSSRGEQALEEALNRAAAKGVVIVAAAGNQGTLGSSPITRHPWVIPVAACDRQGRPTGDSNLGISIGRRGLAAPGERVTSLGPDGTSLTLGGTSAATPFVAGAIALLWSEFPTASAETMKSAVTASGALRRGSVVPPVLNAEAAWLSLSRTCGRSSAA